MSFMAIVSLVVTVINSVTIKNGNVFLSSIKRLYVMVRIMIA